MDTPDNWVIIKIKAPAGALYKILAGWSGGYLGGNTWQLNSGITEVKEEGNYILFTGISGNIYKCHKHTERLRSNIENILTTLQKTNPDLIEVITYSEFIKEFENNWFNI
jgi:hypothetical protein